MRRIALAAAVLLAVLPGAAFADRKAIEQVVDTSTLKQGGEVFASRGEKVKFHARWGFAINAASGKWRWAAVNEQLIATLVMQEVAAGHIDLDKPVSAYLPKFASANAARVTVRQLLRHQSGLPDPDDTAGYYTPGYTGSRDPLIGYCAGPVKGAPGRAPAPNNCDYAVAGALLEAVTGKSWQTLVRTRITGPLGMTSVGAFPTSKRVVAGKPEAAYDLAAFGVAAALFGTARDLWVFDRALMKGKLLPETARAQMWDGQAKLGNMALGQRAFTAPLKGCQYPVHIVEQRGKIGAVEVRNFILPEWDVVLIVFADHPGTDFGEVSQGKGFSYDLLSAATCT